jgi:hypothetical protein
MSCRFAFDWDNDVFACSKTMGISNRSFSLSHEYHHRDSLRLTNGKDRSKQHSLCSVEEAYYLVEGMLFVSIFPLRGEDVTDGRVPPTVTSLVVAENN